MELVALKKFKIFLKAYCIPVSIILMAIIISISIVIGSLIIKSSILTAGDGILDVIFMYS